MRPLRVPVLIAVALTGLMVCAIDPLRAAESLQFNRDIRPILANHCLTCHGPDGTNRKAGLRLDIREKALTAGESGVVPIVPGKPAASELIRRILATNADESMPPKSFANPLAPREKELLKRWVAEGAKYEAHWAYLPPRRESAPHVTRLDWPRNPIDNFILARLEREKLPPSVEADPATLLRRLALDLTGLPPSAADVAAFEAQLRDNMDLAAGRIDRVYAAWVDRFLASPHYGERMAVDWLDAARYADTNGYQIDRDRRMWAWRDWVIAAFNKNEPFNEFTIEQLAGDLLPHAGLEQKIATGFQRNPMFNEESGAIPEEFLTEYCADRVETTATVWLGQTLNCCRCHDHKFDPFTQRDYYSLLAFYHNLPEVGLGNAGGSLLRTAPPILKLPAPQLEAKIASLTGEAQEIKRRLAQLAKSSQTGALQTGATQNKERTAERRRLEARAAELKKQIQSTDLEIPTAMVMQELPQPRPTFILVRGQYNHPGTAVTPDTPSILPSLGRDLPHNRLGLARWLVDPANPLTARVVVNRLWQSLFGVGLVKTAEDFGTQGEAPSHPELLDWLATEYIRTGWDTKAMLRLMVTSATYRQSSQATAALLERDPENRLLARGARFRLQAEFLRDQALAASGLLAPVIGGPSVRPYHPPGLYEQVVSGFSARQYQQGTGFDLYRRSVYTYWKRSVPPPSMSLFGAPFREQCTVRRPRTNTPLQALNLLNDPTYLEASRVLAARVLREQRSPREQIADSFRRVLIRPPRPGELDILVAAYERALADFEHDPKSAAGLLKAGEAAVDRTIEPARLAAMTMVASTLFNLDETATKD